jgi:hypothetical protein
LSSPWRTIHGRYRVKLDVLDSKKRSHSSSAAVEG